MTDTVNVPREWLRDAFLVLANGDGPLVKKLYEDVQEWLAAAPKAEPVSATSAFIAKARHLLDLAEEAEDEALDGDEGCVWPVEALRAAFADLTQPEAQKGEPVAWHRLSPQGWVDVDKEDIGHYRSRGQEIRALYTDPAPSSELLAYPMATAPRNHTWVRLLVDYSGEERPEPLEDAVTAWTIGFNGFDNDGEDNWQFVGWDWSHDVIVKGSGRVIGWLPFHASAAPSSELLDAAVALVDIVEGVGVMAHGKWTDEHGLRLKDTPEWVAFYNIKSTAKHKGPQS